MKKTILFLLVLMAAIAMNGCGSSSSSSALTSPTLVPSCGGTNASCI